MVNNNISIIGTGPIGLVTACTLRAINKNANITLIDKRENAERNHGLLTKKDSLEKIISVLKAHVSKDYSDSTSIQELITLFKSWKGKVQRTRAIEDQLTQIASKIGIKILRGENYEVRPDNIKNLFENDNSELSKTLRNADIIVGADGSHSVIREKIMGNVLKDKETLQYLIELKMSTSVATETRTSWQKTLTATQRKVLTFETIGKSSSGDNLKPATLHIMVDKETYEKMRPEAEPGKVGKGEYKNPWTLKQLEEASQTDKKIKKIYDLLLNYIREVQEERDGYSQDHVITAIPMSIFLSEHGVKIFQGKKVVLVGDASSGLVFIRGFNKGIIEASYLSQAISDYIVQGKNETNSIPEQFQIYDKKRIKLFKKEAQIARLKNIIIKIVQALLKYIIGPILYPFTLFKLRSKAATYTFLPAQETSI